MASAPSSSSSSSISSAPGHTWRDVANAMESIAPLKLAESWDNVGLLVEPRWAADGIARVRRVLLTNDLTAPVMAEAVEKGSDVIISYHPPIFAPLKRLGWGEPKQRLVLEAVERGIAVFSPHTACDSAYGGVNDWMANGLGELAEPALPVTVHLETDPSQQVKVVVFVPEKDAAELRGSMSQAGAGVIGAYTQCSFALHGTGTFVGDASTTPQSGQKLQLENVQEVRLEMVCSRSRLQAVAQAISAHHPYEEPAWEVYALEPTPLLLGPRAAAREERTEGLQRPCGAGRRLVLNKSVSLSTLVDRVKARTRIPRLRVAVAEYRDSADATVQSIALCAGSGWSVLRPLVGKVDVILTGEMSHHDVLAATAKGTHVILCEHSNSERGYISDVLQGQLQRMLPHAEIFVAESDHDPLVSM